MGKTKSAGLNSQDARRQAEAAAVLMSIIPAMAVFFMGSLMYLPEQTFPPAAQLGVLLFTTVLAFGGYQIIRKYPENILKLREYIGEIAKGALPEKITLLNTQSSDDLKFIETNFNAILGEMRKQIANAEERLRIEQALRKTIEQQQQTLVDAERHRTMIQSLGAACHHLSQPATVLCMRLQLLKEDATSDEVRGQIEESMDAVEKIRNILEKLGKVSEFKTVPYIEGDPDVGSEILDIG